MSQVKVYGLADHLNTVRESLSDVIHTCVVDALQFPANKRAHRFFPLTPENMVMPAGRSNAYTIIEFLMIEGRSVATRKKLIRLLYERIATEVGIAPTDVEICILESPACNWGFRGLPGDEITLNYQIDI